MPKDIVQTRLDAPRAERVKQNLVGIRRLIRVELIKQVITRMARIDQLQHFAAQHFDLLVIQQTDAGDISVFAIELHLLIAQTKLVRSGGRKQLPKSRITPAPKMTQKAFGRNRTSTTTATIMINNPIHV